MVYRIDFSKKSFNFCIVDNNLNKLKFIKLLMNLMILLSLLNPLVFIISILFLFFWKMILKLKLLILIDYYFANNFYKTDKKDAYSIAIFGVKNPEIIDSANSSIKSSFKIIARKIVSLFHQKAYIKTKIKDHLNILFSELENNFDVFRKFIFNI